jgi:hypothetical protein
MPSAGDRSVLRAQCAGRRRNFHADGFCVLPWTPPRARPSFPVGAAAGESWAKAVSLRATASSLHWAVLHSRRFSCEIDIPNFELKLRTFFRQKFHNLSPLGSVSSFPEFAIEFNILSIKESVHCSLPKGYRTPDNVMCRVHAI